MTDKAAFKSLLDNKKKSLADTLVLTNELRVNVLAVESQVNAWFNRCLSIYNSQAILGLADDEFMQGYVNLASISNACVENGLDADIKVSLDPALFKTEELIQDAEMLRTYRNIVMHFDTSRTHYLVHSETVIVRGERLITHLTRPVTVRRVILADFDLIPRVAATLNKCKQTVDALRLENMDSVADTIPVERVTRLFSAPCQSIAQCNAS